MQNIKRIKSSEIEFKDKLVSIQRVTKVTKGGRTFSFSAVVVVGNENGVVGYGLGKAKEVTAAIAKGVDISEGMLEIAKKRIIENKLQDQVSVYHAGVVEMDNLFEENSFDLIVSTLVFSELYSEERALALHKIRKLLKP